MMGTSSAVPQQSWAFAVTWRNGNLVRQSNVGEGSVVFGPIIYDVPLLPFEKQLIET